MRLRRKPTIVARELDLMPRRSRERRQSRLPIDGAVVIRSVLDQTNRDVGEAKVKRQRENAHRVAEGRKPKAEVKEKLSFAIYFAKNMGSAIAEALRPEFPRSRAARFLRNRYSARSGST